MRSKTEYWIITITSLILIFLVLVKGLIDTISFYFSYEILKEII